MEFNLNKDEKIIICKTIRAEIEAKLNDTKAEKFEQNEDLNEMLNKKCGAFVTLHLNGNLKGCIGNIFGTMPLLEGIRELAISSAFRDPRFPPLTKEEYDNIEVEVSVLSPLWKAKSVNDIEIGKHGVLLRYGMNSAVFLPQVATEQNWDRSTFLNHLCYKAGLVPDILDSPETEFHLFTALIFKEEELL